MSANDSRDGQGPSTRPYLIRALHDWCTDHGFTPYIAVFVDANVDVPMDYVKNNEIVLNVSFDATSQLVLGNDWIEFQARFGGVARSIKVPCDHVIAIYARENGQGMAFPMPSVTDVSPSLAPRDDDAVMPGARPGAGPRLVSAPQPEDATSGDLPPEGPAGAPAGSGRPALKRVK